MTTPDDLIDEEMTEEDMAWWNSLPDDGEEANGELGVTTVIFFPNHPVTPAQHAGTEPMQPQTPPAA